MGAFVRNEFFEVQAGHVFHDQVMEDRLVWLAADERAGVEGGDDIRVLQLTIARISLRKRCRKRGLSS